MTQAVNIAQSGSNNVTFRNRLINGAMMIDQRNAGAAVTPSGDAYFLDRWLAALGSAGTWFTFQQNSGNAPTTQGFTQCMKILSTGANTPASGTIYVVMQKIEGNNFEDFAFGTASAKSATLSFWVNCSVTGTYSVVFANSAITRAYGATYTVNSANTWEQKTITITGDTTGTWLTGTNTGLRIMFNLGTGSSNSISSGSWQTVSGNAYAVTGTTQLSSTNAATMYITGVQFEQGTAASPFENRLYGTELLLCQRYFEKAVFDNNDYVGCSGFALTSGSAYFAYTCAVEKRTTPTWTSSGGFRGQGLADTGTSVSYSAAQISNRGVNLIYSATYSGTNGQAVNLQAMADGAYLQASAEL